MHGLTDDPVGDGQQEVIGAAEVAVPDLTQFMAALRPLGEELAAELVGFMADGGLVHDVSVVCGQMPSATTTASDEREAARRRLNGRPMARRSPCGGVDLDVAPGGGLALLGRNGAGKSTLIKLLAGVERPDSGTIEVTGQQVTPGPGVQTGLAFIHQDLGLIDSMTVAENIAFDRGYPTRGKLLISWSRLHKQSQDLLDDGTCNCAPPTSSTGSLR
jgi:ABC-type transport system involved in cytochrome bd biosynthesis fused ATPase/permease subunit